LGADRRAVPLLWRRRVLDVRGLRAPHASARARRGLGRLSRARPFDGLRILLAERRRARGTARGEEGGRTGTTFLAPAPRSRARTVLYEDSAALAGLLAAAIGLTLTVLTGD